MYQAPKLEKFGTFRQLTQTKINASGKSAIGDDQIPGIGLDCNPRVPPSDPTGCLRS
jgi:hypothetical protein